MAASVEFKLIGHDAHFKFQTLAETAHASGHWGQWQVLGHPSRSSEQAVRAHDSKRELNALARVRQCNEFRSHNIDQKALLSLSLCAKWG